MGNISHSDELKRKKYDVKLARAHELALEEWPDEHIDRLSEIVRGNPWFRALDPWPADAAFIAHRRRLLREVEVEPTWAKVSIDAAPIHDGWRVVEDEE